MQTIVFVAHPHDVQSNWVHLVAVVSLFSFFVSLTQLFSFPLFSTHMGIVSSITVCCLNQRNEKISKSKQNIIKWTFTPALQPSIYDELNFVSVQPKGRKRNAKWKHAIVEKNTHATTICKFHLNKSISFFLFSFAAAWKHVNDDDERKANAESVWVAKKYCIRICRLPMERSVFVDSIYFFIYTHTH